MSKFLYELEKKWGKYAIQNLPLMLILCYAVGYLIDIVNSNFLGYLRLNPYLILHGQVWRILTWIVVPPSSNNIFLVLIMLYFYYSISRTLEMSWGTFYLNVYLLSGILLNVIGSFVIYFIGCSLFPGDYINLGGSGYVSVSQFGMKDLEILMNNLNVDIVSGSKLMGGTISHYVSTYYMNMAIFLAYAATFPNNEVLLMFLIPIKVKVLGIIYAILMGYEIFVPLFEGGFGGGNWIPTAIKLLSVLNFIIFFFSTRKTIHLTHAQRQVRKNFRKATGNGGFGQRAAGGGGFSFGQGGVHTGSSSKTSQAPQMKNTASTRHKCAVCGQTEKTAPDLSFRFCTKCEGSYEYCENHIFTHTHVKKS